VGTFDGDLGHGISPHQLTATLGRCDYSKAVDRKLHTTSALSPLQNFEVRRRTAQTQRGFLGLE